MRVFAPRLTPAWMLLCACAALSSAQPAELGDGSGESDERIVAPLQSTPIDWAARRAFALEQNVLGTALAADPTFQLHKLLAEWRLVWEQGRADEYLAFYSDDFVPTGSYEGWERQRWIETRRDRLRSSSGVEIGLDNVVLIWPRVGRRVADSAQIEFRQWYQADGFSDVVDKRLEVQREPAGWRVVREMVLRDVDSSDASGAPN